MEVDTYILIHNVMHILYWVTRILVLYTKNQIYKNHKFSVHLVY